MSSALRAGESQFFPPISPNLSFADTPAATNPSYTLEGWAGRNQMVKKTRGLFGWVFFFLQIWREFNCLVPKPCFSLRCPALLRDERFKTPPSSESLARRMCRGLVGLWGSMVKSPHSAPCLGVRLQAPVPLWIPWCQVSPGAVRHLASP